MKSIRKYVHDNRSQSHLCICNTFLFEETINNGIYGFPHQGIGKIKSFWRAVASMFNIGPKDLLFIYRTSGSAKGCREIHGPFKIFSVDSYPAIYYDRDSADYPMKVKGTNDCKVRFLFEKFGKDIISIADNYELIKKYESKEIWGYRHPAVMNIGAARKKSVTSFTNRQTTVLLDLIESVGVTRSELSTDIPAPKRIEYYNALPNTKKRFKLDDEFLLSTVTNDEAFLYSYILRGLKTPSSKIHESLIKEFSNINDTMLVAACGVGFRDISTNVMMETVISPHLQDELDIVLMDVNDSIVLIMEVKDGSIDRGAVLQTQKYLDLLRSIFPHKNFFANIIGSGNVGVYPDECFKDVIKMVSYRKLDGGFLKFDVME